jgi:alkanesulfonate monooxygenase SsuD/methylene tetrahydromethanopterin reductase-like flavin-dependent oxidoreductase (luciferase family)
MAGANPYREPTLVAKMASTLDHISTGRAILGIGAARCEDEAHDFGFPFGSSDGERLRWLGEALPIVLLRLCETVGRDPDEIERTASIGTVFIRDHRAQVEQAARTAFETNRTEPWYAHVGAPEDIAAELAPYLDIGYRHLIANFPAPYDEESMTRLATEVRELIVGMSAPHAP